MSAEMKRQPTVRSEYDDETMRRMGRVNNLSRRMAVLAHCKRDLYEINESFTLTIPESRKVEAALQVVTDLLDLLLKS